MPQTRRICHRYMQVPLQRLSKHLNACMQACAQMVGGREGKKRARLGNSKYSCSQASIVACVLMRKERNIDAIRQVQHLPKIFLHAYKPAVIKGKKKQCCQAVQSRGVPKLPLHAYKPAVIKGKKKQCYQAVQSRSVPKALLACIQACCVLVKRCQWVIQ